MATVSRIEVSDYAGTLTTALDLNSGALALELFVPIVPALVGGGYDLETDLQHTLTLYAKAATADALANALNELDRILLNAAQNNLYDFVWQLNGGTTQVRAGLRGGRAERNGDVVRATDTQYVQRVTVTLLCEPVWRGAWVALVPNGATPAMTNDLTPYVILDALLGELPAPCELSVAVAGGNAGTATRIMAALKVVGANFNHLLQVETATYLDASLTTRTDAGFSPGTGNTAKRWVAPDTNELLLARWELTTNLDAYRGMYLAFVRARENTAPKNYLLRLRAGVKAGGQYIPGAWGADYARTTKSNAAATTEELLIPVGIVAVLKNDERNTPAGGIYFELWGEADAALGSIDLDALLLFPLGESGGGLGCVSADFVGAFSTGRPVLSSRPGAPRAFARDTATGNYLTAAKRVEGGNLFLQPRIAGQRIYFLITLDEPGFFMHDRTVTLTFSGSYSPRFIHAPGTI